VIAVPKADAFLSAFGEAPIAGRLDEIGWKDPDLNGCFLQHRTGNFEAPAKKLIRLGWLEGIQLDNSTLDNATSAIGTRK